MLLSTMAWFGTTHPGLAGEGPGGLPGIAQREVARRQQLLTTADAQIAEALKLGAEGKHDQAAEKLSKLYNTLPDAPAAADVKGRVRAAWVAEACAYAQDLLAQGRKEDALKVLDTVLTDDVDPKNPDALRLKKHANDPDRFPPALTPEHIANVKKVQELLTLAGSAADLGDLNKAKAFYQDVLRVDRYNVAAQRGLAQVEQHRLNYFDSARDATRARMLSDVSAGWADSVPPSADMTALFSSSQGGGSVAQEAREKLQAKLRSIRVPRLEINGATMEEAVEYLRVSSKNLDPEGTGVSFVLNVDADARNRPITLNLQDMPLEELIRYVTETSGVTYRVESNAVIFVSLTEKSTSLVRKTYRVPPDFIQKAPMADAAPAADPFAAGQGAAAAGGAAPMRRLGAKEFLESRGVAFPNGGSASYLAGSSSLVVNTSAENMLLVDQLVEEALGAAPKQAKISVRVVDVQQKNMDELGFETLLGQFNLPGSNRVFGSGGTIDQGQDPANFPTGANGRIMSAGLRSSGALFGVSSIESEIAKSGRSGGSTQPGIDSRSPTQFALTGVLSDPQFQMSMRAIQQRKGTDLVTVPSVVAKSGQKSSIRSVRLFPYPTEFDPPQIPQSVGTFTVGNVRYNTGNTSGPITPTTPTAFEKKELGIILEVEPVIDGRTVELALTPSLTEFEGFINYGSDISNRIDSTGYTVGANGNLAFTTTPGARFIQANPVLQPVFRKTGVTTAVKIYDGQTVVLGGLLDEKTVRVNDKVPVIGDIPLVGRLWQSKATQTQRRAILFFVTVEIIDPAGQKVNTTPTAAAAPAVN